MGKLYPPLKLTRVPKKRDHFKRKFHLPTIDFQRLCSFLGGSVDALGGIKMKDSNVVHEFLLDDLSCSGIYKYLAIGHVVRNTFCSCPPENSYIQQMMGPRSVRGFMPRISDWTHVPNLVFFVGFTGVTSHLQLGISRPLLIELLLGFTNPHDIIHLRRSWAL